MKRVLGLLCVTAATAVAFVATLGARSTTPLASVPQGRQAQQAPELVLVRGKVFTSDTARPRAEAVAIRGERIVAVGTSAEVRRLAGPRTRIIDVGGRVVVPGFNDAHDHISSGNPGMTIAMGGAVTNASGAQIFDSLRAATERVAPGTWIRVEIWTRALVDTPCVVRRSTAWLRTIRSCYTAAGGMA